MKVKDRIYNLMTKAIATRKDWHIRSELTSKIKTLMESLNSRISLISKISMPRLLNKSFNWIKSHLQIITTKDGYGCNSLGFVWPWSLITLTSSENALPHPLHTCLFLKKDSSLSKLLRSLCKQRRKNKLFFKNLKKFLTKLN